MAEQNLKFWHPIEAKYYKNNPEIPPQNPLKYPLKITQGKKSTISLFRQINLAKFRRFLQVLHSNISSIAIKFRRILSF